MPTTRHGMVRRLLREHKAKVVKRCPFTIQLRYECANITQPITLGVDTGYENVGISACTEKKVLFEAKKIQEQPNTPNYGEFTNALNEEAQLYFLGEEDIDTCMSNFTAAADKLRNE